MSTPVGARPRPVRPRRCALAALLARGVRHLGRRTTAEPRPSRHEAARRPSSSRRSSLAPPALKGLSEGVKGYADVARAGRSSSRTRTSTRPSRPSSSTRCSSSGRAGAAWVIAVAPEVDGRHASRPPRPRASRSWSTASPRSTASTAPQPGISFDYIDYTAGGKALGDQLGKCITEKLGGNGRGAVRRVHAPGQAGKAEFEAAAEAALKAAAPERQDRADARSSRTAPGRRPTSATPCRATPTSTRVMSVDRRGRARRAWAPSTRPARSCPASTDFGGNDEVLKRRQGGQDLRLGRPAVRGRHDAVVRHAGRRCRPTRRPRAGPRSSRRRSSPRS